MSMAPRTGGSFFFLKIEHVSVVAENKRIQRAYQGVEEDLRRSFLNICNGFFKSSYMFQRLLSC